jgi:hypothetical protein
MFAPFCAAIPKKCTKLLRELKGCWKNPSKGEVWPERAFLSRSLTHNQPAFTIPSQYHWGNFGERVSLQKVDIAYVSGAAGNEVESGSIDTTREFERIRVVFKAPTFAYCCQSNNLLPF